jgi:peptide/nickel transport system ATP-binding protein
MSPVLSIRDLRVSFAGKDGPVPALRGVDLDIEPGECVGLVGESGCGKSLTALAALGLLPPSATVTAGTVRFGGRDLLGLPRRELDQIRGRRIAMIFQEPMTALNPVLRVGEQIGAPLRKHLGLSRQAARGRAVELLALVGIPSPATRVDAYPHQLSGGMRQRVMIAMALACGPDVLIADEPTTALDGTIQAQILDLLRKLQSELGMAILLITHDLGVVAETCDEVVVMYAGRVVERAPTEALFAAPRHHYTAGLLRSVPSYTPANEEPLAPGTRPRLREIPGMVPPLHALPVGCKFADRCPAVGQLCRDVEPPLVPLGAGLVRCHYPVPVPGEQPITTAAAGPVAMKEAVNETREGS